MKKIFLSAGCGLLCLIAYSQNQPIGTAELLRQLLDSMKLHETHYVCREYQANGITIKARIVDDPTFDSAYNLSTSRILTSSQDVVKNGKAAALDFNEALKRLTINYSWKGEGESIWNAGLVAEESSKKLFEIFGKKGWKEGFTFNFGKAIPIGIRTILFHPDTCDVLKTKRESYYAELLKKYETILATPQNTINGIRTRKTAIDTFRIGGINTMNEVPAPVSDAEKKLLAQWDELESYRTSATMRQMLSKVYSNSIRDFEVANLKNYGYKLHWLNWNIGLGLKRFTIYDTAVVRLAEIDKKSLGRISATFSYNSFRESIRRRIYYFSAEFSTGNTNYLEEILPSEITELKSTSGNDLIKEDYDALIVKDYESLKKGYGFVGVGLVFNYFPGKIGKLGRFLGFEMAGNTKFKVFEPEGVTGRDVFSLRGGLLFTFEQDKIAKTTFGIIATLTDIPFNDITSKDRFGIGIRIGVPFNY